MGLSKNASYVAQNFRITSSDHEDLLADLGDLYECII